MKKKLPIVVCLDFVYLMYNSKKEKGFQWWLKAFNEIWLQSWFLLILIDSANFNNDENNNKTTDNLNRRMDLNDNELNLKRQLNGWRSKKKFSCRLSVVWLMKNKN